MLSRRQSVNEIGVLKLLYQTRAAVPVSANDMAPHCINPEFDSAEIHPYNRVFLHAMRVGPLTMQ